MSKLDDTRKKGMNTLIALAVIAVAVYVGFTPLYTLIGGGVAGAVVGSSFGAIFVIILTMYLLNKQTEIEQESKKSERVFDEKVKIYKQILETTKEMVEDGKISYGEISKLPFLMMELQMLGGDEAISTYEKVFSTLNEIYGEEEDEVVAINDQRKSEIYKKMSEFSRSCRVDLGVTDRAINQDVFNKITGAIETTSKVTAKRRTSANTNYADNAEEFFKTCEKKGRSKEVVDLSKKFYKALTQEYSSEIATEKLIIDFAIGKDKASHPKMSVKAAQANSDKLTRICTISVRLNELNLDTIFKSPKWDYKQLKIGDIFVQHSRPFWEKSSFYNAEEESIVYKAYRDYLPELKVKDITNLDETTLKILLFAINESKKVVFESKKLPRGELLKAAETGDNNSLQKIKNYIAEDYIQELTLEEIDNITQGERV